jgi:hypothetical protein
MRVAFLAAKRMIGKKGGSMDDLISRQEAIEALKEHRNLFCDNTPETFSKLSYAEKSRVDELDMAIATLINLPSAQLETHDKRTKTHSCDCISRQAAMEEISKQQTYKMFEGEDTVYLDANDVGSVLASLSSAQPELPEWAQKVEEYRKSAPSFVRNQLVWALYQTWKEYDGRLEHQRGKENRCLI